MINLYGYGKIKINRLNKTARHTYFPCCYVGGVGGVGVDVVMSTICLSLPHPLRPVFRIHIYGSGSRKPLNPDLESRVF